MIIFWYVVTILVIAIIIAIAYINNNRIEKSKIVTTTTPDYKTCINTTIRTLDGRFLSIRTYPIKNCKNNGQECGSLRRTQDFEDAVSPGLGQKILIDDITGMGTIIPVMPSGLKAYYHE